MATLYEVTIRTRLDAAGLKAGDRQAQIYFDSIVARARRASAEMEQGSRTSMSRTKAALDVSMKDRLRAIEQANAAELKAERAIHAESVRIQKQKDAEISRAIKAAEAEKAASARRAAAVLAQIDRDAARERERNIKAAVSAQQKADAERAASARRAAAVQAQLDREAVRDRERNIKAAITAQQRADSERAASARRAAAVQAQLDREAVRDRERNIKAAQKAFEQAEKEKMRAARAATEAEVQAERDAAAQRRQIATTGQGLKTLGQGVKGAGMAMSLAVTAPIAAAAAAVISIGSDYEKSMNIFQATSRATAEEMQKAGKVAIDLGADLTLPATSAADAGDAMTALSKKGFSATQSMQAARGVLQLATATMIDTAQAAEVVAGAVHMFGLEASNSTHIADLFASASVVGGTTMEELSYAFQQAGPVFRAANVSIEDTVALLSELAINEIKGEKAGTSLRAMMLALTAPSAEARKLFKDMKVEIFDGNEKIRSMRDIIKDMAPAFKKMTDEQRLSNLETIFGRRAMGAALIVMNEGAEGLDRLREAQGKQGAAAELAAARTKGLAGAFEGFKSQVETLALTIFAQIAPALTVIVQFIAKISAVVGSFAEAHPTMTAFITVMLALAATIGPLLIGLGLLISLAGSVATAYVTLSAAVTAATAVLNANLYTVTALTFAVGTLTVVLLAAVAVIGVLVYLYASWESAADKANNITMEQVKIQATAMETNDKLAASLKEVSAAQAGSKDQHEKLNAIIGQLNPNTQAYVSALDSEQKKLAAVTDEVLKLQAASRPISNAQIVTLAPGLLEQKAALDDMQQLYDKQVALINRVNEGKGSGFFGDKRSKEQMISEFSEGLIEQKRRLDEAGKAFQDTAAKIEVASSAAGYNREALMGVYSSAAMGEDKLKSLGNIYDILHPKIDATTASTTNNAQAIEKQAAALNKVKAQLRELAQGTDQDQAQIERTILDVVSKAGSAAEATRLAREAAKNPEIKKLIDARKLHTTAETAAREVLEPNLTKKAPKTAIESLEQQVKKAELAIKALYATGGKAFTFQFRLEDAKRTMQDLEGILKLRHELGIPLTTALPRGLEAIKEETRILGEQKKIVDSITTARNAQSTAEFELAGLIMQRSIPLIDAETRSAIANEKAVRARSDAEIQLTADIRSAVNLRNAAREDERDNLRDTREQYKQLQLEAIKDFETARIENIKSQLKFAITTGAEPKIQADIEAKLKTESEALKSPIVSINQNVATIVKQMSAIIGAMSGKSGGAAGPEAVGGTVWTLKKLTSFIAGAGFETTSTTGGSHNKGSLHYLSRAADVRTRGRTTAEVNALIEDARAAGLTVFDERTRPKGQEVWGGPHVHMQFGAGGQSGRKVARQGLVDQVKKGELIATPYGLIPKGEIEKMAAADKPDVMSSSSSAPLVNAAVEKAATRALVNNTAARAAVEGLYTADQRLADAEQMLADQREIVSKLTDKTLEQYATEAALKDRAAAQIQTDLAGAVAAGVVQHDLASRAANDSEYQVHLQRLLTEATRSRADAENKTLDELAVKQDHLNKVRGADPETMRQMSAKFRDDQLSALTSLAEESVKLDYERAHAGEDAALRYEVAWKKAINAVSEAEIQANESSIASEAKLADALTIHGAQVRASVLDHLAQQKTITETMGDMLNSQYDTIITKVDAGIDKLTGRLGMINSLLKSIVNQVISRGFKTLVDAMFGGSQSVGGGAAGGGGARGGIGGFLQSIFGGGGSPVMGGGGGGTTSLTGGFGGGPGGAQYIGGGGNITNPAASAAASLAGIFRTTNPFGGVANAGGIAIPPSQTAMGGIPGIAGGVLGGAGRGAAGRAASTFSLSSLSSTLGPMAPLLGLTLGMGAGGNSNIGKLLGGAGGLLAGLGIMGGLSFASGGVLAGGVGLGAASGLISSIPGLGALSGLFGGLGGSLGAFAAVAGPLAVIAAPLIIGAIIFAKNKQRQQDEKKRNQASIDTLTDIYALLGQAQRGEVTVAQANTQWEQIHQKYLTGVSAIKDSKTKRNALLWWDYVSGTKVDPGGATLPILPKIIEAAKAGEIAAKFKTAFVPTYGAGIDNGLVPYTGGAQTLIKVRPGERIDDVGSQTSWTVPGTDKGYDSVYTVATPGSGVYTKQQQQNIPGFDNGSPAPNRPIVFKVPNTAEGLLLKMLLEGLTSEEGHQIIVDTIVGDTLTSGKLTKAIDASRR